MYNLTAADFADTGQWRLLLQIWPTGLEASLENTIHPELPLQQLCSVEWEINKDRLRQNIEDAVYNNPRLLDDFATRIVLFDPRTLFIPTEIAERKAGSEEELYQEIYTAEESDIMSDTDRDITAVWSLAPGVKSFLMRTFPGARITCNLMNRVRDLRKSNKELRVYAYARPEQADIIFLDGSNLISASTHEWSHPDDLAYMIMNVIDVYHLRPENVGISSEGIKTDTKAWNYIKGRCRDFQIIEN